MKVELQGRNITAGELRKMIEGLANDSPILIVCENAENEVGYNASTIEFYPPAEDKQTALENDEPCEATLFLIF